ncbi:hypothetical protein EJ994_11070 [Maribacter sp. MJ134]|uniref:hypothetical protein n=1 Tax=Maribacter sp. MJ134 TaxID=2496865 RepID=UPI000F815ED9|nr:hypothetical protein [Maribacter sp. MJ134]AZQ59321.1 hypothetical protein EJ994_11070 [Maribacter sp. MJ134]
MEENTLLHRQVHPSFIQGDRLSSLVFSSQTFKPTPKDEKCLSVYNGDKYQPDESYEHYVDTEMESVGVVSVSLQECNDIELPVVEDNIPFDGHSFIDYREKSNSQIKKKATLLKKKATERGWQYRP